MKNIAIVVTTPMTRQGVTSVVLNLIKNMDRTNLQISFLSALKMEDWFCDELKAMDIEVVRLVSARIKKCNAYIRELSAWLKANQIDVLHVHGNSATMWFEIKAAKKADVPIRVAHSHSSRSISRLLHSLLKPLLVRDMTLGIGCSDLSRTFAFGNSEKSMILNNGIQTDRFQYDENVRLQYRKDLAVENTFVIGHVGNLLYPKNHMFMCRVAHELSKRGVTGWRWFFIGDGADRGEIEEYLNTHGLSDSVILLGVRSDVAKLYQALDLFVLPSFFEGFPMVLVEAQTSGLDCLISEEVSKTTNLIDRAKYLPIDGDDSIIAWADAIEQAMHENYPDRQCAKQLVEAAGFSAKASADILRDIYGR